MESKVTFTDDVIQSMFGHEAAEDEKPERLKNYYFKTAAYEKVHSHLDLRILVGHKGIGKSALFTVAMDDDRHTKVLPIMIRPDDVTAIGTGATDFLTAIRDWKEGLITIIAKKALEQMGIEAESNLARIATKTGWLLTFLKETAQPVLSSKVNLSAAQKLMIQSFLHNRAITVYIDDLDRGWEARKQDISRISALLNAMRDLCRANEGLRFRLSLRSDVYYLVRTSDESTDKVEGSVIWFTWTNHEILALLAKRIESYFGRTRNEGELLAMRQWHLAEFLKPVMDSEFGGKGKWANVPTYQVIMSLIRKRPRDLVKLCTLAARRTFEAARHSISTEDFELSFEEYSQGRVRDTINEFQSELPEIERLLINMKPNRIERRAGTGYIYKTDELLKKIGKVIELGRFTFRNGAVADAKDLAAFLYKINFLTARKVLANGEIDRKYFEENRYLSAKFADFGYNWEIHPAYRWALQPDTLSRIYDQLDLSHSES